MTSLSLTHLYWLLNDYGNNTLDITSPSMIFTQKMTALAFAYHDGIKSDEKLSSDQRSQVIRYTEY